MQSEQPLQTSVDDLRAMWSTNSIPLIPFLHKLGIKILDDLSFLCPTVNGSPASSTCFELLGQPAHGSVEPSIDLVVHDLSLSGDHSIFDFASLTTTPALALPDLAAQSMKLLARCSFPESVPLCGALNIVSTPEGIGRAALRLHPFDLNPTSRVCVPIDLYSQDDADTSDEDDEHMENNDEEQGMSIGVLDEDSISEEEPEDEKWISVVAPPSAVTQPHIDFYGASQYIVHISGDKLWFFWPPTPENLANFERFHETQAEHDRILFCLRNLRGLETMLLTSKPAAFVVKPCTIHACMSFTQSAHASHRLWTASHVEVALQSMTWGLAWMRRSIGTLNVDAIVCHLARIRDDFAVWGDILESRGSMGSSRRTLHLDQLKVLESELDSLQRRV